MYFSISKYQHPSLTGRKELDTPQYPPKKTICVYCSAVVLTGYTPTSLKLVNGDNSDPESMF